MWLIFWKHFRAVIQQSHKPEHAVKCFVCPWNLSHQRAAQVTCLHYQGSGAASLFRQTTATAHREAWRRRKEVFRLWEKRISALNTQGRQKFAA